MCYQILQKRNLQYTECNEVSDMSDSEITDSSSSQVGKFLLRAEHREILPSDQWLNDQCAQTLLKLQFPQFGGLQPTIGQGKYSSHSQWIMIHCKFYSFLETIGL